MIDIGCGHGRYALALAALGADVIGVDTSVTLLNRAQDLAADAHTQIRLVRGDMRRLPIQSARAGGAIILDAFGFFDSEKEHGAVLQEAARVLAPDARLVLKIVNGGLVIDDFRPTDQQERDGVMVTIDRSLAVAPARMTERIRVTGSRGNGAYERRQRLYRAEELHGALERAGFDIVGVFSDADGAPFEPNLSATMWFVCQRATQPY